jgi:CRISPR-associated protein (TIGR03984 family)
MNTNGLKYDEIKTTSISIEINSDGDILKNAPANAWFIAYLDSRVVIGRLENNLFSYYKQLNNDVILENIQKLRVFNNNDELFVWRTSLGGHRARLRTDESGTGRGIVDANQVLFGTEAKPANGDTLYSTLTEKRGTEIIIPLVELGIKNVEINAQKGRLCIHTRSYIGTIEETGQATYEDVRFVEFVKYQEV